MRIRWEQSLLLPWLLVSGAGCPSQTIEEGDTGPLPEGIEVIAGADNAIVPLDPLPVVDVDGQEAVTLLSIVESAAIVPSVDTSWFELVGADGFRPSNKDCAPLSGTVLDRGYLTLSAHNVMWDEALGYAGCYHVKDLATIEVTGQGSAPDPDVIGSPEVDLSTAGSVQVRVAGLDQTVDLSTLSVVWVDETAALPLQGVVQAVTLPGSPADYVYDFEAGDGYRPTGDGGEPRGWSDLAHGGIEPGTHDLVWARSLSLRGFWGVHDVAVILVLQPEGAR